MIPMITLAKELQIPEAAVETMVTLAPKLPWDLLTKDIDALLTPASGAQAVKNIEVLTAPFAQNGLEQLCVYLTAALHTREIYRQRGIPDEIFINTMQCFGRFMQETYVLKGIWAYDRGFWTWRQLSCILFRLGCLEYEYLTLEQEITDTDGQLYPAGEHVISVHIPTGAVLSQTELDRSYGLAKSFFAKAGQITAFIDRPRVFFCSTWLLSPSLVTLCKPDSGIRRFADMYRIVKIDAQSTMYISRLFGADSSTPLEQYKEETSLQRAAKKYLLAGGVIGGGVGLAHI